MNESGGSNALKNSTRIEGLDLIRAASIFMVVFEHVIEAVYTMHDVAFFNSLPEFKRHLLFFIFEFNRLSVPMFFYLTGYLLLTRDFDQTSAEKFYRRNFLSLFVTWEAWIVLYNVILAVLDRTEYREVIPAAADFVAKAQPLQADVLLGNMIFIKGVDFVHAWYVGVILGIYLFIPVVSRTLKIVSDRELFLLTAVAYIYYFIVPTANFFTERELMVWIDVTFSGGMFGTYVILGYMIHRFEARLDALLDNRKIFFGVLAMVIGLTYAMALVQLDFFNRGELFLIWNNFCLLPPASVGLFLILKRVTRVRQLTADLSRCSFGIYLIHIPILTVFLLFNPFGGLSSRGIKSAIWVSAIFALSYLLTATLSKVPGIGKILFRVGRKR